MRRFPPPWTTWYLFGYAAALAVALAITVFGSN
jgi:hypothetical protein